MDKAVKLAEDTDIETAIADIRKAQLPPNALNTKPEKPDPQRDAIHSVVDDIITDICKEIGNLRHALDDCEQRILESVAGTKLQLNSHLGICHSVKGEVTRIRGVIDNINQRVNHDNAS